MAEFKRIFSPPQSFSSAIYYFMAIDQILKLFYVVLCFTLEVPQLSG